MSELAGELGALRAPAEGRGLPGEGGGRQGCWPQTPLPQVPALPRMCLVIPSSGPAIPEHPEQLPAPHGSLGAVGGMQGGCHARCWAETLPNGHRSENGGAFWGSSSGAVRRLVSPCFHQRFAAPRAKLVGRIQCRMLRPPCCSPAPLWGICWVFCPQPWLWHPGPFLSTGRMGQGMHFAPRSLLLINNNYNLYQWGIWGGGNRSLGR